MHLHCVTGISYSPSLKYSFTKPTTDQLLARVKNIQRIGMKKIKQKSIQNINNQASRVLSKASCLVWVVTDKFQSMKNQTEANWDCKLVSKACIEYRGRMKNAFSICKKRNKVQWLAHGDPKSTEELCAPSISSSWLIRVTYPHFTPTYGHFLLHIGAYRDAQYARFARAVRRFWTRIKRVLNATVHASISVQLLLSNFLSPNRIFNIVSISSQ